MNKEEMISRLGDISSDANSIRELAEHLAMQEGTRYGFIRALELLAADVKSQADAVKGGIHTER